MPEIKPSYEQLLAENIALREENQLLRQRLGIYKPKLSESQNEQPINLFPDAAVTRSSPSSEKIDLFMTLFRGREDVYAKRWYSTKTEKSGYSPVCLNEWELGICDKHKYKCNQCPNRNLAPLHKTAIFNHLSGKSQIANDVVGLYPMTADEYCWFLAIDFDDADWKEDVTAFHNTCRELNLTASVERSRSGDGGHIWFFFEEKIPVATARKFGSALLTQAMSRHHKIKFNSYDRFFSKPGYYAKRRIWQSNCPAAARTGTQRRQFPVCRRKLCAISGSVGIFVLCTKIERRHYR